MILHILITLSYVKNIFVVQKFDFLGFITIVLAGKPQVKEHTEKTRCILSVFYLKKLVSYESNNGSEETVIFLYIYSGKDVVSLSDFWSSDTI